MAPSPALAKDGSTPSDPNTYAFPSFAVTDTNDNKTLRRTLIDDNLATKRLLHGVLYVGPLKALKEKVPCIGGLLGHVQHHDFRNWIMSDREQDGPISRLIDELRQENPFGFGDEAKKYLVKLQNFTIDMAKEIKDPGILFPFDTVNLDSFSLPLSDQYSKSLKPNDRALASYIVGLHEIMRANPTQFRFTTQRRDYPFDAELQQAGKVFLGFVMEDWFAAFYLMRYLLFMSNAASKSGATTATNWPFLTTKTLSTTTGKGGRTLSVGFNLRPYMLKVNDIRRVQDDDAQHIENLNASEGAKSYMFNFIKKKPLTVKKLFRISTAERIKEYRKSDGIANLELWKVYDKPQATSADETQPKPFITRSLGTPSIAEATAFLEQALENQEFCETLSKKNFLHIFDQPRKKSKPKDEPNYEPKMYRFDQKSEKPVFNEDRIFQTLVQEFMRQGVDPKNTQAVIEFFKSKEEQVVGHWTEMEGKDFDQLGDAPKFAIANRLTQETLGSDLKYDVAARFLMELYKDDGKCAFTFSTTPSGMIRVKLGKKYLHPHQVTGPLWMAIMKLRLGLAVLNDDTGLGKTIQCLASILIETRIHQWHKDHFAAIQPPSLSDDIKWVLSDDEFTPDAVAHWVSPNYVYKPTLILCTSSAWQAWTKEMEDIPQLQLWTYYGNRNTFGKRLPGNFLPANPMEAMKTLNDLDCTNPSTQLNIVLSTVHTFRCRTSKIIDSTHSATMRNYIRDEKPVWTAQEQSRVYKVESLQQRVRQAALNLLPDMPHTQKKKKKKTATEDSDEETEDSETDKSLLNQNQISNFWSLLPCTVGLIIVDEAHEVENIKTQSAQAIMKAFPTKMILCSATIMHAGISDLRGPLRMLRCTVEFYSRITETDKEHSDAIDEATEGHVGKLMPLDFEQKMNEYRAKPPNVWNIDHRALYEQQYLSDRFFRAVFNKKDSEHDIADLTTVVPLIILLISIRRIKFEKFRIDDSSYIIICEDVPPCQTFTIELPLDEDQSLRYAMNHDAHANHIKMPSTGFAGLDDRLPDERSRADEVEADASGSVQALSAHRALQSIAINPALGNLRAGRGYVTDTRAWAAMDDYGYSALHECMKLDKFAQPHKDAIQGAREILAPSPGLTVTLALVSRGHIRNKQKTIVFTPNPLIQHQAEMTWCMLFGRASFFSIRSSDNLAERTNTLNRFNDPDDQVYVLFLNALLSYASLNLQFGSATIIILGVPDSTSTIIQQIGRSWRIGQETEVHAYLINTRFTYEDACRARNENRHLEIMLSSSGARELPKVLSDMLKTAHSGEFVHVNATMVPAMLAVELYYRMLLGQRYTTRFWFHNKELFMKTLLEDCQHPPTDKARLFLFSTRDNGFPNEERAEMMVDEDEIPINTRQEFVPYSESLGEPNDMDPAAYMDYADGLLAVEEHSRHNQRFITAGPGDLDDEPSNSDDPVTPSGRKRKAPKTPKSKDTELQKRKRRAYGMAPDTPSSRGSKNSIGGRSIKSTLSNEFVDPEEDADDDGEGDASEDEDPLRKRQKTKEPEGKPDADPTPSGSPIVQDSVASQSFPGTTYAGFDEARGEITADVKKFLDMLQFPLSCKKKDRLQFQTAPDHVLLQDARAACLDGATWETFVNDWSKKHQDILAANKKALK